MNKKLTDITLVVDRSGSMQSCRADAEGGVNAFIEDQKKGKGDAVLTLHEFDDKHDTVCEALNIKEVEPYTLFPRGSTALLDAIGKAIISTGGRLEKMKEKDRPGLVVFVVQTDGWENMSIKFTNRMVNDLINEQEKNYSWKFIFLGAGKDAIATAAKMGFKGSTSMAYNTGQTTQVYASTSNLVSNMRDQSVSGGDVTAFYSEEDREGAVSE